MATHDNAPPPVGWAVTPKVAPEPQIVIPANIVLGDN